MDQDHNRLAMKVHHQHARSSSRVSNSSTKANRELDHIEEDIGQNNMIQATYTQAVDAIDQAAIDGNHGKAPTGEGIDFVREEIKQAQEGPKDFSAARGQGTAA